MIAAADLKGRTAEGVTFPVGVRIGIPYHRDDGAWACAVELQGLYEHAPDVVGDNSFQALCLAVRHAMDLVQHWRDAGGEILTPDGHKWPADAYLPLRDHPPG